MIDRTTEILSDLKTRQVLASEVQPRRWVSALSTTPPSLILLCRMLRFPSEPGR